MSTVAVPAGSRARRARLATASDERLALRVRAGDEQAFALLYERHHQALFRYCRSILRHDTDAQDALQSTFERALSALREGRRNAPLRPWLFRIAHNEAITVVRRRASAAPPELTAPAHAASAAQEAERRARMSTLMEDLVDLPERPRSALVMRELVELSHEEIAVALGITVGAAKQAIFEARRALQEAAEGRAMACEEIRRKLSDGDRRALRGRRMRAHLRDCTGCAAFAAAIPERRAELRALVPGLPPAAAAAILTRALASSAGHGAAVGAGLSTGVAGGGAVGKGVIAAALSSKAAVGAAVLATAAAGAGGVAAVVRLEHHAGRPGPARSAAVVGRNSTRPAAVRHAGAALPVAVHGVSLAKVRAALRRERSALVRRRLAERRARSERSQVLVRHERAAAVRRHARRAPERIGRERGRRPGRSGDRHEPHVRARPSSRS